MSRKFINVNWWEITRVTSSEKEWIIKIESFKIALYKMLMISEFTLDDMIQTYPKKASSRTGFIIEKFHFIIVVKKRPKRLKLKLPS